MKFCMTGNKGFALFYALLVASLALAIGATIFDLTLREIDLANSATQSQYSVYIADSAGECALYWDNHYINASNNNNGGSNSAFATSSASAAIAANSGLICSGSDITSSAASWTVTPAAGAATTTFNMVGIPFHNQTPCAYVTISKVGNPPQTVVTAHGYNTCAAGAAQYERVFQITY